MKPERRGIFPLHFYGVKKSFDCGRKTEVNPQDLGATPSYSTTFEPTVRRLRERCTSLWWLVRGQQGSPVCERASGDLSTSCEDLEQWYKQKILMEAYGAEAFWFLAFLDEKWMRYTGKWGKA